MKATESATKDQKLHLLRIIAELWGIDDLHLSQMFAFEALAMSQMAKPESAP
jgi:hypothetical protein